MTVEEAIEMVATVRPHPLPDKVLTHWLGELEGRILVELHDKRGEKLHVPSGNCPLVAPPPYDRVYWTHLVAMVDLFTEHAAYGATKALYEEAWEAYARFCHLAPEGRA